MIITTISINLTRRAQIHITQHIPTNDTAVSCGKKGIMNTNAGWGTNVKVIIDTQEVDVDIDFSCPWMVTSRFFRFNDWQLCVNGIESLD